MTQHTVRRIGAAIAAISALAALAPGMAQAQATSATNTRAVPIAGTFTLGGVSQPLTNALFVIERFANQNGQLVAVGTLTDPVTGAGLPLTLPVTQAPTAQAASCQVLDLALGPLHLDLLGLVIDLNPVLLNITAEQGAGNLLGNLLCAVTNLLNGPAGGGARNTNAVVNLLNNILGLLG